MIKKLNDIDTGTPEGKILIATLGRLCSQPNYGWRHPDDVLQEMVRLADDIYKEK